MIHAGRLIERTLHDQGRTVTWFAEQMSIKYFRKKILTFISFGVSPVFSNMIFFVTSLIALMFGFL